MKKLIFLPFFILLLACGCCKSCDDDDDDVEFSTKPVTNNPRIVPNHGSGMPFMQNEKTRP